MTPNDHPRSDQLDDLLVERATQGLSDENARLLDELLLENPRTDRDSFDLAAAALEVAFLELEPCPSNVKSLVRESAEGRPKPEAVRSPEPDHAEPRLTLNQPPTSDAPYSFGWVAAAAACVLALWGWLRDPVPVTPTPAPVPTLAQRVDGVRGADDLIARSWKSLTDDPVQGEVVWSTSRQEGYMILRGLPASTGPEQYQLWIVDSKRDVRPVDGGVFDMPDGRREVIVPIDAKLEILDPKAFVLTLEQEGGVVVSDGPHLVLAEV